MDLHWFPLFFVLPLLFIGLVWGIIIFVIGRGALKTLRERKANREAPQLTFPARVIGKRDGVSGGGNSSARSHYYVTFERLDLQRLELEVEGPEFGMLAVGDYGRLTHQGTWYQGFAREVPPASAR
ncbi:DUF2500 domain-containing protein [Ornithinimicrobium sp. F0845]|uniref:DUF2500 domain-containing protein n=1 Tax=Ornithinimicrobium sp. F0845 TaxID=2926412 RepID=UPI001FF438DC|nr:DUF2500 domain-containing protein [Ornithinimicrobium sp. F0845]MCK0111869.1 DUF2500 domain-containing protein [Ornithinimicrobium sp. F0845]